MKAVCQPNSASIRPIPVVLHSQVYAFRIEAFEFIATLLLLPRTSSWAYTRYDSWIADGHRKTETFPNEWRHWRRWRRRRRRSATAQFRGNYSQGKSAQDVTQSQALFREYIYINRRVERKVSQIKIIYIHRTLNLLATLRSDSTDILIWKCSNIPLFFTTSPHP